MTDLYKKFLNFHAGKLNKLFHLAGFTLIGFGIVERSLWEILAGAVVQELGHVYQYAKTRDVRQSPLHGLKSQAIFAFPLLFLIILYVLAKK